MEYSFVSEMDICMSVCLAWQKMQEGTAHIWTEVLVTCVPALLMEQQLLCTPMIEVLIYMWKC